MYFPLFRYSSWMPAFTVVNHYKPQPLLLFFHCYQFQSYSYHHYLCGSKYLFYIFLYHSLAFISFFFLFCDIFINFVSRVIESPTVQLLSLTFHIILKKVIPIEFNPLVLNVFSCLSTSPLQINHNKNTIEIKKKKGNCKQIADNVKDLGMFSCCSVSTKKQLKIFIVPFRLLFLSFYKKMNAIE